MEEKKGQVHHSNGSAAFMERFKTRLSAGLNRLFGFRCLRALSLNSLSDGEATSLARPLSREELRPFQDREDLELVRGFVDEAFLRGDSCFGIIQEGELISYGFLTSQTTYFVDTLWVHFGSPSRYLYKCFTHPAFRGRRLNHEIAKAARLSVKEKILVTIEPHNTNSIRSFVKMGAQDFGWTAALSLFGTDLVFSSPACRIFGLSLEWRDAPAYAGRDGSPNRPNEN
jgi:hypothetical protein